MGEVDRYSYTYKELAECLVKKEGIHDGIWSLRIEFGLGAGNVPNPDEKSPNSSLLAAIVPINKIGIQKVNEESPTSVNASQVNPAPKTKTRTKKVSK